MPPRSPLLEVLAHFLVCCCLLLMMIVMMITSVLLLFYLFDDNLILFINLPQFFYSITSSIIVYQTVTICENRL